MWCSTSYCIIVDQGGLAISKVNSKVTPRGPALPSATKTSSVTYFDRIDSREYPYVTPGPVKWENKEWKKEIKFWGFQLHSSKMFFGFSTSTTTAIVLPLWVLLLVVGILPALSIRNTWRQLKARQRRQNGCCIKCGYDLRATPDRCPECGAVCNYCVPQLSLQTQIA
jgi:hypothetical protein